jgi:NAD(P)H-dependent FMN reductase
MMEIVCVSGTNRPGNFTARALAVVHETLGASGHSVTMFDGRDIELGFPGSGSTEDARNLREAVSKAAGLVLATPEYHGSFSSYTKLVIENLGFPSALAGKPVALLGVAAGRIGAIKSLEHLKGVCSHVGALVVPGSVSIAGIQRAFDDDGALVDASAEKALRGLADSLTSFMRDYVCPREAMESLVRGGDTSWTATV